MNANADDLETMRRAVLDYIGHQPLDAMPLSEITRDLRTILTGARHYHRRSIGGDQCLLCRHDLRDPLHLRVGEKAA